MSLYRSFEDLEKIDAELANYFKQKEDAIRWCMAIEGPIAQWVNSQPRGEGGKALWELVWFASVRKGVFDEKVPRNKQAEILTKFCPAAFCKPENSMSYDPAKEAKALQTSMEHYSHINSIKLFDTLPYASTIRKSVNEIEALLDGQQLPPPPVQQTPTIEERVEAYLRNTVNEVKNSFPRSIVNRRKDFGGGIVPELSVTKYVSQDFLDKDKPSHVVAYEFVDTKLTTEKLYAFNGKYGTNSLTRHIKLYVVSPFGFDKEVMRVAEDNCIGLVLVNRNVEMTTSSYKVQRSIEDYSQRQHDINVLLGNSTMSSAFMIYDTARGSLTTSLADSLVSEQITVKPGLIIRVPFLRNEEIERMADNVTKSQVEGQKKRLATLCGDIHKKVLGQPCINIIDLEINPYTIAKELGISYLYTRLPSEDQLGYLDVNTGTIYLQPIETYYHRDRFTIAHELGHHQLHLSLFRQYHYTSIGENNTTINEDAAVRKGELRWFEHHANYFAACLLMPKALVKELYAKLHYIYLHERYGDRFGPLYYNPEQIETFESYHNVVERMAKILNVSTQAMHLRLKKMGLLITP